MVRHPRIMLLSAMVTVAGCTATEMKLSHDNPLDRIYDSGAFRMVLTGEKSGSTTTLTWSNVYYTDANGKSSEVSDTTLKTNGTVSMLRSAAAPTTQDLNAVKSGSGNPPGFSTLTGCTVAAVSNKYSGSCDITGTNNSGYYIIQFNYTFTDDAGIVSTGILYSNFVSVQ